MIDTVGNRYEGVAMISREPFERISMSPQTETGSLVEALQDLAGVKAEANEQGYPEPTSGAIETAGVLVRKMHGISAQRYDIYPTDDGEVVIDVGEQGSRRLFVFCYPNRDVLFIGWVDGERRDLPVSFGEDFPAEFVERH